MEPGKVWEEIVVSGDIYSPRTGHTVSHNDRFLYLFGGTDGMSRKNDTFQFDPVTATWSTVIVQGTPPIARSGSQSTRHDMSIYFFGGYTKKEGEYFNDLFKFDTTSDTWSEILPHNLADLPPPRTDHSLVEYQNSLFVFGGYDGRSRFQDLHSFSLSARTWRCVESEQKPEPRFGHTAVVCRDRMLIFGGWNGHDTLNDSWTFQFQGNKWAMLTTTGSISARYRHAAVALGNSIFVFGGVNKDQVRFNDLHELNMNSKHWSRVLTAGDVPSPRTFHKAVIYENFLYILGGFDGGRRNDMYRISLQSLSPEEDIENNPLLKTQNFVEDYLERQKIEAEGATYSPRTGHCALLYDNKIYVFGGTDEESRRNDLFCFDLQRWSQVATRGEVPYPRSGAQGVGFRLALYIFGGYTRKDGTYFNDLHRLDLETCNWTKIFPSGELPVPRTDHTCVLYENGMYIFGGYDGRARFNDLRLCNLEAFEWEHLETTGSQPASRFGHSAVVYNHHMYIFGGWDGHETLDDLYQYSFASRIWYEVKRIIGPRPNPRYRHSCVVYKKRLFVFGGVDKQQRRYNDLHEFNISKREWVLKNASGHIPTARTFHRALLVQQSMHILGGFDGKRQNDLYKIRLHCDSHHSRPSSSVSRLLESEDPHPGDYNELLKHNFLLKQELKDLMERLEKEEERDVCHICFSHDIDSVVLECAHRFMCFRCAQKFTHCPVCRQSIVRVVRTYNSS